MIIRIIIYHMILTILLWSYDYTYYYISYDNYYIIMIILLFDLITIVL